MLFSSPSSLLLSSSPLEEPDELDEPEEDPEPESELLSSLSSLSEALFYADAFTFLELSMLWLISTSPDSPSASFTYSSWLNSPPGGCFDLW